MKGKKGKKTPSPVPPKKVEEAEVEKKEEPPVVIDSQKLTFSESAVLDPNQLLGTEDELFIPDDASSIFEDEKEEAERGGVLLEESVAVALSNIGTSASGTNLVYLSLSLPAYELTDISVLSSYVHLQNVNLSYNKLKDLSALSNMKHLVELDVSHNELQTLFDFIPPLGLRKANFSHNSISDIPDLSAFKYLIKLNLDQNNISEIKGLHACESLKTLTLSGNQIEKIEGLENLRLRTLSLSGNRLTKIENLESVTLLQDVDLSNNNIFGLSGFTAKHQLHSLNMADNQICEIEEMQHLVPTQSLRALNFSGNPVCKAEDYRKSVIFAMQQLQELDQTPIRVEEKVAAINLFDPPAEVQAALDHITHTVYRFLQPSKIYESTLPSIEMPYPMLVLTGPRACGKRELAHRLAQEFPDYFGLGISHTTRVPYPGEQDGKDYHFVTPDQFNSLVRQGFFIQTFAYAGCLYGLTLDAVETVAKEGLACVVHMEINGIRSLKNTYFEPRYVLVIPTSEESHRARMVERGVYSNTQMDHIIRDQSAVYKQINQDHPGFFDMVINNNKLGEAYERLRQLVMDYLGTTDLTSGEAVADQDIPKLSTTENKDETSTHHTTTSANMKRTWSRPSHHGESSATNDIASGHNRIRLESRKTPVEEASYKRRVDAAKEAIEGYSPSAYDELFRRPLVPMTAPGLLEGSPLAQAASMYQDPAFAPVVYPNLNTHNADERMVQQIKGAVTNSKSHSSTPDSSNESGQTSIGLSGLSSARRFSDEDSLKQDSSRKYAKNVDNSEQQLDLTALSDALESLKSKRDASRSSTPLAPRLTQDVDSWLGGENEKTLQLGANAKPVLPAIPSGGR